MVFRSTRLRALAVQALSAVFQQAFRVVMALVETNVVPDFVTRFGIRLLLAKRLAEVQSLQIHNVKLVCVAMTGFIQAYH